MVDTVKPASSIKSPKGVDSKRNDFNSSYRHRCQTHNRFESVLNAGGQLSVRYV